MPVSSAPLTRFLALSVLTGALLSACGGGGSGPSQTTPATPNPTPPAPVTPAPVTTFSVSGVLTFPGATGAATDGSPDVHAARTTPTAAGTGEIPGEYLIVTRPGLSVQGLGTLTVTTPDVGVTTLRRVTGSSAAGLALYRSEQTLSGLQSRLVAQTLLGQPGVQGVTPNRRLQALATPNDPYYPVQWQYPALNLPAAWDRTTGAAVTVAVVDSGVVPHADLRDRTLPGMDFVSDPDLAGDGNGVDPDPTDLGGDTDYHGTHVAGSVAAHTGNGRGVAGVSWGARIVPVRALDTTGGGSLADILGGVLWAAGVTVDGVPDNRHPARIVNLSLGGPGACSAAEQRVFAELRARQVVTVVAAGNDDVSASTSSPGNCADVITVGATGPDGRRAPYSNHGARIDVMAPGGNSRLSVSVNGRAYPGGILSTVRDAQSGQDAYAFMDGTSMAAPHVAGAAALLLGQEPTLTPDQVRARLRASAAPLGSRCDVSGGCGAGLIDVNALLGGSSPAAPAPTPPVTNTAVVVAALFMDGDTLDASRSEFTEVPGSTLRPPYTLRNLNAGTYLVAAWQDTNDDGQVNDGEPFGVYPDPLTLSGAGRALTGIDLTMEAAAVTGASLTGSVTAERARQARAALRALTGSAGKQTTR
ncbi:S8 family serine peptidase [Deinococcus sp. RIT780]|uniref:S8 family serine peptidase n=1 Tax=Deinococcus sp. RIT780 TaxID=2870472 RepID=UPI001C899D9A|nr:S8 family serine peptidase [Deinococcus sp. RIT780]MBX8464964.1 S8 family serine peptidase [Deinococcus sp. RIT780]